MECYWSKIEQHNHSTPIVVLYHGLAGSFESPYIQGSVQALKKAGFSTVIMHFRGCATKANLLPRSYHSGETQDALEFLKHLHTQYPQAKLFGIGYSLGANMLLKLLGEMGENSLLCKAVAVSAPLELEACANYINQGFSQIYQSRLLKELNKSLAIKYEKHPMQALLGLEKKEVYKLKSFWEFDAAYTAPIHGFSSAKEYYTQSSAKQFLHKISISTLIIHALDDPFMPASILPKQEELPRNVHLEVSENGGHVGFVGGTLFKPEYWLEKRMIAFLEE